MAVRKRQTAWDILTKLALKTVRTRFETIESGSKQKQNERFAWDLPQFHTPDLQRRPRRPRRLSIMRSVDILAQAMPSAPKNWPTRAKNAVNVPLDNFIPLTCREDRVDHVVFPSCVQLAYWPKPCRPRQKTGRPAPKTQ